MSSMNDKEKKKGLIVEIIRRKGSKGLDKKEPRKKDKSFGMDRAKKNIIQNLQKLIGG